MRLIGIDPGNFQSAYCVIDKDTLRPIEFDIVQNDELVEHMKARPMVNGDTAAIEMLQSYGTLIGKDVLETAVWIGRYYEALRVRICGKPTLIFRIDEKLHICHDSKAGDSNVRRALIDRFANHDLRSGRGTVKNPDWFYGFHDDIWAAYAVAITCAENGQRAVKE